MSSIEEWDATRESLNFMEQGFLSDAQSTFLDEVTVCGVTYKCHYAPGSGETTLWYNTSKPHDENYARHLDETSPDKFGTETSTSGPVQKCRPDILYALNKTGVGCRPQPSLPSHMGRCNGEIPILKSAEEEGVLRYALYDSDASLPREWPGILSSDMVCVHESVSSHTHEEVGRVNMGGNLNRHAFHPKKFTDSNGSNSVSNGSSNGSNRRSMWDEDRTTDWSPAEALEEAQEKRKAREAREEADAEAAKNAFEHAKNAAKSASEFTGVKSSAADLLDLSPNTLPTAKKACAVHEDCLTRDDRFDAWFQKAYGSEMKNNMKIKTFLGDDLNKKMDKEAEYCLPEKWGGWTKSERNITKKLGREGMMSKLKIACDQ